MHLLAALRELRACIKGGAVSLCILSIGAPQQGLSVPRVQFRFRDTGYVKCTVKKVPLCFIELENHPAYNSWSLFYIFDE
jgi:hypothetical protein